MLRYLPKAMDINLTINQIMAIFKGFIGSPFFLTLKLILAIYITVLFADIIMLIILRGMGDIRTSLRGANVPLTSPKKMRRRWRKIESRLETADQSQYKLAIIEADKMVDKIFISMGLKGDDMIERIKTLTPEQLEAEEDLEISHKTRNQIINDPSFAVDKGLAKTTLDIYEKFLTENELME
jgi:hypothetical protein